MPRRGAGMPMRRKLLVTEPTHVDRSWCGGGPPKQLVWWSNAKADGVLEGCHSPCPVTRGPLSGHQSISVRSPENLCLATRELVSGHQRTSVRSTEDLRPVTRGPPCGHQRTCVWSPEDLCPVTRGPLSGHQRISVWSTEDLRPVNRGTLSGHHGVLEGCPSPWRAGGTPKQRAWWRDAKAGGVVEGCQSPWRVGPVRPPQNNTKTFPI